ncbi:MAG: hypothetical protein HY343_04255 [Lentisphaerae bacterium]|nr:hypothetical protein [Lentisphaerota bacterium]
MTDYIEGQVVKGKIPPKECPPGMYWRKTMGLDEFKLYTRKERKPGGAGAASSGETEEARLTVKRVADGVRFYMQNEDGFKQVMEIARLSGKALENLAKWSGAAAVEKIAAERARLSALSKANDVLRAAGLVIGADNTVQPIPTESKPERHV